MIARNVQSAQRIEIEATIQIPYLLLMGITFPTPWKTLIIKFPSVCPAGGGGGMLKLRFDRYIRDEFLYLSKSRYEIQISFTLR